MAVVRQQTLNWKMKANIFNLLDRIPKGNEVYYLLQRYVTKSYPRRLAPTSKIASNILAHVQALAASGGDLSKARIFEFGAGWDLYSNLVLYCLGATDQWTIDVRRLVRTDAVNAVLEHLANDPPEGAVRIPKCRVTKATLVDDLKSLGIRYLAPADARHTEFEGNSVDFILTTSVLEHVPRDVIEGIVAECHRILRDDGIMSHIVDYSDHYSHADATIGNFNYLRFSQTEWKKYNPDIHFQNRLRKAEYLDIFSRAGFEIVKERSWLEDPSVEIDIPIDDAFAHLSEADIRELGSHFILKKRAGT